MVRMGLSGAFVIAAAIAGLLAAGAVSAEEGGGHFTLWMLPEQTHSQMTSFVMKTDEGRVVVIDGGTKGDAAYLAEFIKKQGGEVEAWFITHPHSDHSDALVEILNNHEDIGVKRIYASLPPQKWLESYENQWAGDVQALRDSTKARGLAISQMAVGQLLLIDGVRFEVFAVRNPELTMNAINNSSVVMKVSDGSKSVLFFGDLGPEGGEKLVKSKYATRLKSDYVQMAHHGQNGVSEDVYQAASPSYCLWTTPDWLWENDNGGGKGSGPWQTLEVRAWMEKLPVKRHYVTCVDGLVEIP